MVTVYYDSQCGFCSSIIDKIKKKCNDIHFCDLTEIHNSGLNEKIIKDALNSDSLILLEDSQPLFFSEAIIRIFAIAGGYYKVLAMIFKLVPSSILNRTYRLIANIRYCLPALEQKIDTK